MLSFSSQALTLVLVFPSGGSSLVCAMVLGKKRRGLANSLEQQDTKGDIQHAPVGQ